MTEIEIRIAAIEMVIATVGALVDEGVLDGAAEIIHSSLASADDPDERAILQRALRMIGRAQDHL